MANRKLLLNNTIKSTKRIIYNFATLVVNFIFSTVDSSFKKLLLYNI